MAGIQGIAGLITPIGASPTPDRPAKRSEVRGISGDGDHAVFSSEAQGAAELKRLAASAVDEGRQARLEQARKSIEQGAHRLQSVVELVASRVSKYLE
ncbi:MAG: hypothetical protein SGI88_10305 [Candidatus Hydrogenedentes bacterium]|nr:hypothetical protein [Candidatus Hydrogenedentota bacterium]